MNVNELALFSGAGGGLLASRLLGWRTVCAVEIDKYCQRVLLQRQRDGHLEKFPIWDDVRTFDGTKWRGKVDIVSGGFPCQDISAAGNGAGINGERSGLWTEFARIIGEVRPKVAFVENSPMLTSRGLGRILGDLAELGRNAKWGIVAAEDAIWACGSPSVYHERGRIWIISEDADARCGKGEQRLDINMQRRRQKEAEQIGMGCRIAKSSDANSLRQLQPEGSVSDFGGRLGDGSWWRTEPELGRVAYGVAHGVDRLRAIGNGQVPAVVVRAWEELTR